MNANAATSVAPELPVLLRGEAAPIRGWIEAWSSRRFASHVVIIVLGTAAFGAAIGCWRAPMQALFTAIKFPLILLLTALGNGLLNGMLAPLLGVNISFRQALLAILMSFTIASAILGAFSPLVAFLIWNTPPLEASRETAAITHSVVKLVLTGVLAFAGIAGNVRLLQLLRDLSGSVSIARRTLVAWLVGNLLLGSQLAWILRPFVGAPYLPVEFLRRDAFESNFFENLISIINHLSH